MDQKLIDFLNRNTVEREVIESVVPCNGCNECCRWDAIWLKPHLGDNENDYETEVYLGRKMLKHKPNGDCIYLDRDRGCSIHDRRPVVCREFDCLNLLRFLKREPDYKQYIPKRLIKAARRRRDRR